MNCRCVARAMVDIFADSYKRLILLITNALPGQPGNIIIEVCKRKLLRMIGVSCAYPGQVSSDFYVFKCGNVSFGKGCSLGSNFKIWNFHRFEVGENLLASHNITVICGTHKTNATRDNVPGPIAIGNNVWIGANVLIVGPASIGDNSIIGANSFVTGKIRPNWIYAGSPAKPIRIITHENEKQ